jgi:4-aminobutyrate aminotransferase
MQSRLHAWPLDDQTLLLLMWGYLTCLLRAKSPLLTSPLANPTRCVTLQIYFQGGFHGRTIGAMALTSSKTVYRQGFSPLMPGAFIAPYPYCLHCKVCKLVFDFMQAHRHDILFLFRLKRNGDTRDITYNLIAHPLTPMIAGNAATPLLRQVLFKQLPLWLCILIDRNKTLQAIKWMLQMQTAPSETAAIILEPVLGEGGFLTPPPSFLRSLRELCSQHGIMLISDEVWLHF